MITTALLLIALCAVVLTAVLLPTLLALKRVAFRAETVLMILEREIRPLSSQIQALAEELRALSRHAGQELERVGVVAGRVDDLTNRIARIVGIVGGLTRVGQLVGAATGVKKGWDVFITRWMSKNKKHESRGRTRDG
ncbi:MAG: DUF948 domain-containing protein [Candidatus Rokubacteria bacterium]|nr:DUF948 domain-containing protein [Candidatus Rokubacteria bacterium]